MRRSVGAGVISICLAIGGAPPLGGSCALAQSDPGSQPSQRADEPVTQDSDVRLLVKLAPGAQIRVDAAQRVVIEGEAGWRADVAPLVLEGLDATSARPLYDMSAIGNPELARQIGLDRYYIVSCADLASRAEAIPLGGFAQHMLVEFMRFDTRMQARWTDVTTGDAASVDDPEFEMQWGLENFGQVIEGVPGVPGADIGAYFAWLLVGQTDSITVAVLDAGVSATHPDLEGQVIGGRNFAGGDPENWTHGLDDHGTRVAGVISAVRDNGVDLAGVTKGAKILSVRVLNDLGLAFPSDAAPGVVWAADNGADILNMSFGWPENVLGGVEVLRDAVEYAHESGCLLVGSSGNLPDIDVLYPAAFDEVMAVGATDNRDKLWVNSTRGPEISVVAPGKSILLLRDNPFQPGVSTAFDNGTSFAAPLVAGAAAVIWAEHPELTNDELQELIESTAVDLGQPGFDHSYGHGRLDLLNALLELDPGGMFDRPTCLGDFDSDGDIDLNDLLVFLLRFGDGSFNADVAPPFGELDFHDVLEFLRRFGEGCFDDIPI